MSPPSEARRPLWRTVLGAFTWALVLGLTVALLLSGELTAAFAGLDPVAAAAFVALSGLSRVLAGLRWGRLSRAHLGITASWFAHVRLTLLGEFANVWLPSFVGGEAAKVLKLEAEGHAPGPVIGSLVIDRVLAAVSLLVLCVPFLPSLVSRAQGLESGAGAATVALLVVVLGGLVVAAGLWLGRKRWMGRLRWMPEVSSWALFENGVLGVPAHVAITLAYVPLLLGVGGAGLWEIAAIVLVSRIGRVVPVHALGVNSVEGLTVALGALYGMPSDVLLVAVGLNVGSKYVWSIVGALIELAASGTGFLRGLVRRTPHPS